MNDLNARAAHKLAGDETTDACRCQRHGDTNVTTVNYPDCVFVLSRLFARYRTQSKDGTLQLGTKKNGNQTKKSRKTVTMDRYGCDGDGDDGTHWRLRTKENKDFRDGPGWRGGWIGHGVRER
ncbi:hypothetical protein J6590_033567 [Homalodisca vitripennis]|nr:hypothetical protein J6590_033567 [Homalodisca vitripennis]